jgi:hypothetical protein
MTHLKISNARRVKIALILIAGTGVCWVLFVLVPPVFEKICQTSNVAENSEVIVDGERLWIDSLKWNGSKLEVICCREYVGPEGFPCVIEKPWGYCYCLFWDKRGVKTPQEVDVAYMHDLAFIRGESRKECVQLTVDVPRDAARVAVRYEMGNWQTKQVRLPQRFWLRPLEDLFR